jgi:hypothetical protein
MQGKYDKPVHANHILVEYYLNGMKYIAVLDSDDLKNSFFPVGMTRNCNMILSAQLIGVIHKDITDIINKWLGPAGDFHMNKFSAFQNITWERLFAFEGINTRDFDTLDLMGADCVESKFTLDTKFLESAISI